MSVALIPAPRVSMDINPGIQYPRSLWGASTVPMPGEREMKRMRAAQAPPIRPARPLVFHGRINKAIGHASMG